MRIVIQKMIYINRKCNANFFVAFALHFCSDFFLFAALKWKNTPSAFRSSSSAQPISPHNGTNHCDFIVRHTI
jgi:hypothetical protein